MQPIALIAIPTFGKVHVLWAQSRYQIAHPLGSIVSESYDATNADIATKRNDLVKRALEIKAKNIFFLGDDVTPPPNVLLQLLMRRRQGARVITGVYWTKGSPSQPYIWKGYLDAPYYDWHVGDYFKIDWSGCDCLLIDTEVFREIPPPWFSIDHAMVPNQKTVNPSTEDLYFFSKLRQAGIEIWCDAGIQCGHIDRESSLVYIIPPNYPQAKPGSDIPRKSDLLIADIGCGNAPNPYALQGDVVRIDLDPDCKPDVLADARKIPDSDNHYDIVCAYHILEHLPGADSIPTIREWTRILKPGGKLEIKVPNLNFAMRKILDGHDDEYYHMMIYGMQVNEDQVHKTGFTPERLLKAAQKAGGLEHI